VTAMGRLSGKAAAITGGASGIVRLHPGINQEVAPNESRRDPKPLTSKARICDVLLMARWLER
jgi:hypothetical protein